MITLTAEQRRALVGTDETPGLLDQYKVHAMETQTGKHLVVWLCPRQHAGTEKAGHLNVIARNLDGDQTGLTLGELVEAALDHEAEAHADDGEEPSSCGCGTEGCRACTYA